MRVQKRILLLYLALLKKSLRKHFGLRYDKIQRLRHIFVNYAYLWLNEGDLSALSSHTDTDFSSCKKFII